MAADTQPASLPILRDKVRFLIEAAQQFQTMIERPDLNWEEACELALDVEDYAKLVVKASWKVDTEVFEALNAST